MTIRTKPGNKGAWVALGVVGAICTALYPIFIYPLFNIKEYQEAQRINRSGINRQEIQPGNMRVWSDPFEPREEDSKNQPR